MLRFRLVALLAAGALQSAACGGRTDLPSLAAVSDDTTSAGSGGSSGSDAGVAVACTPAGSVVPRQPPAQLALGLTHLCARDGDAMSCWGKNKLGQLGDGTTDSHTQGSPPAGIGPVLSFDLGSYHTCAVSSDGRAWCWGDDTNGVLGTGDGNDHLEPTPVVDLPPVVQISTEFVSSCARTADGRVYCWGENNQGQLGIGRITFGSDVPVEVPGLRDVVHVTVGERHACALLADGSVRCWGDNGYGELGDGTRENRPSPIVVPGLCPAVALDAGGFTTCTVCADAGVCCWGDNADGRLVSAPEDHVTQPTRVPALAAMTQVSLSGRHACALREDGSVWCWGRNQDGELGDGTTVDRSTPAPAPSITGARQVVAAGTPTGSATCIRFDGDDIRCTGNTEWGHLGAAGELDATTFTTADW